MSLQTLFGVLGGLALVVMAALLTLWWRQQTFRWPAILAVSLLMAPLLTWWSGELFAVAPYRAGCDGLCPGRLGAPVATHLIDGSGAELLLPGFLLDVLIYLVIALAWAAVIRAVMHQLATLPRNALLIQILLGGLLIGGPVALAPWYLPPPEATVRGDPQRIAINARREVYLYDQDAASPVLRVGLVDVRPRSDGVDGMRVCLSTYTFFYLPAGYMYLDMTPEGVHSNAGGVLPADEGLRPRSASDMGSARCWE